MVVSNLLFYAEDLLCINPPNATQSDISAIIEYRARVEFILTSFEKSHALFKGETRWGSGLGAASILDANLINPHMRAVEKIHQLKC